jgi:AcrR family transcriptional regulator
MFTLSISALTARARADENCFMPVRRARIKTAYHHGNLRQDLVTAALQIINRKGVAALTLRGVAKRLGVSQTAPYRHFSSKGALLAGVAAEGFSALLARMEEAVAAAGPDLIARYQATGVTYLRFALEHPAHFTVMYGSRPGDFDVVASAEPARQGLKLLIEIIAECQRAGLAAPGDPSLVAVKVWSFVHGIAVLFLQGFLPRRLGPAQLRGLAAQTTGFLTAS